MPCVYIFVHENVERKSEFFSQFKCRVFSHSLFLRYLNMFPGTSGASLLETVQRLKFSIKVILSRFLPIGRAVEDSEQRAVTQSSLLKRFALPEELAKDRMSQLLWSSGHPYPA